ncbi:hypothetical protein DBR11_09645 [Pedobacter sp. HMWF019]|uniref:lysylphosphatidylglycerol synthase transmembrane domain-containing protein n=1 Tax=Pedobacter sp. HMWF019 TaxID=2056856 RepID=UPI000D36EC59|nr:lysylphosphatidylglycerol synthase transmembrane domain-containing protein [Pedobacter sp. HMWF019]PTT00539.1 hypothetical protein DBR11_09645 [Pedobacter sp. HMWF019]
MATIEKDFNTLFKRKTLIKGSLLLSLITIAGLAFVFFYHHTGSFVASVLQIRVGYILLCLLMVAIDLMLGGWRNHIFIRKLYPGLPAMVSFKANTANMFMGAVTPFHSGAGPGQLYIYYRHGVKLLDGFIVSLINMGATLIFMPLAGLVALLAMDHTGLEGGMMTTLLKYGFGVFGLFLVVFLLAFGKPLLLAGMIKQIAVVLGGIFPAKKRKLRGWSVQTSRSILRYQRICSVLLKQNPLLFPLALVLTTLLYLNKYTMQYVILLGLGLHVSLSEVISIQILIQFMIYFAPSPGGSGFAEAGIGILFVRIIPAAMIPVFTLLQRSFLLFIPALIGAWVILRLLERQARQN